MLILRVLEHTETVEETKELANSKILGLLLLRVVCSAE